MSHIPRRWADVPGWQVMVADTVNPVANGYPFPQFDTAPAGVDKGYTYYDTTTNKVRTFNGTAFFDLF